MEVLLLFFLLAVSSASAGCPSSWTEYETSCYALFTTKLSFIEAASECHIYGNGYLAEIETTLENSELKAFLNLSNIAAIDGVWIGGNDMLTEGVFKWDKSEEEITYFDWHAGQPDDRLDRAQDCLAVFKRFGFQWADHYCEDTLAFICEQPATP